MSKPAESTAIHEARWPCDLEAARALLRNYEQHLRSGGAGKAHIHVEGYDRELAELPKYWGGPDAALLLAWREGQAAGCAAVPCASVPARRVRVEADVGGAGRPRIGSGAYVGPCCCRLGEGAWGSRVAAGYRTGGDARSAPLVYVHGLCADGALQRQSGARDRVPAAGIGFECGVVC